MPAFSSNPGSPALNDDGHLPADTYTPLVGGSDRVTVVKSTERPDSEWRSNKRPPAEMPEILMKLRTERAWLRESLSEFIATFIFMLIGEAAMAHMLFKSQHDIFAVIFCWGIAVMLAVLIGTSNSGGHFNPVVTVSMASLGRLPWKKVPHYIISQNLGAFAACALLYANNIYLLNRFDGGVRSSVGVNASGILWTTFPDPDVPLGICVLDTIICSGIVMFGILTILDKDNGQVPSYLHGFYIGLLVMALCWSLGSNCMSAINPARDFAPRLFALLVGYEDVFSYRDFWWVPTFIPPLGGIVGSYLYELTIGIHRPPRLAPLAEIRELKDYATAEQQHHHHNKL